MSALDAAGLQPGNVDPNKDGYKGLREKLVKELERFRKEHKDCLDLLLNI